MLLHIIARGKIGRSAEAELTERYLKRIAWPTKLTELPDRGGAGPPLPTNSVTIALDERGEALMADNRRRSQQARRRELILEAPEVAVPAATVPRPRRTETALPSQPR